MKRIQRVFGDIDALRFVDGRLDEERRAAYVAHLVDDTEEAERVATWSRQNDTIRAAFASVAAEPVPLWLRLGNLDQERSPQEVAAERPRRHGPAPVARLGTAPVPGRRAAARSVGVSAAALIAAGVLVVVAVRSLLPVIASPAETHAEAVADPSHDFEARAIDAYRTFATDPIHPVEIASTQQGQLEHWLQRRLSVPVHAPDLRAQGWSLLGGRLAPGDFGPAAFFVYENETNERMGLYVARTGAAPHPGAKIEAMPGGATMSWVAGPVGVVVAAGKSIEWMAKNSEPLKLAITSATGG